MANLADDFLTGIGPIDTNLDWVDCSDYLAAVLADSQGIMPHISIGPALENVEGEWIEDAPNVWKFSGAAATSGTVSVSSPTTTAAIMGAIRQYSIIGPEDGSWLVQNGAAVTGASLTCTAYANTTFATCSAGTTFVVYGAPWGDKDDASDDISQARTRRYNWPQVFEKAIYIEQTRKAINMKAVPDEFKLQVKRRTLEIKRELHLSIFGMYAYYSGGFTNDSQYRTLAGLRQFIRDYDLDGTDEDTMVTNASSNSLTLDRINTACYNIYTAGGLDEESDPIIVTSPYQARQIAKFDQEYVRSTPDARRAGHFVDTILTDMGVTIPVIMDRYCQHDCLYIIDKNRFQLRFLKGDTLHMEKMAKTGRKEKWQLSMQATVALMNADKCHYLLYGLATS